VPQPTPKVIVSLAMIFSPVFNSVNVEFNIDTVDSTKSKGEGSDG